ncbi:PASTA domain-containing protein [Streptomyces sp. NBC_01378]|uniref:PASTA domain-containing protein n=1 Tax=Streptomyces sp. NBC_01378 TaxID=2903844 RepID=UPI003247E9BE
MKLKTLVSGVALTIAVTALSVGCSNQPSDESPSTAHTATSSASLPPDSLPVRMKSEIKKGVGFSVRDATDLGRTVDLQHAELWRFCLSRKGDGPDSVDLGAVPYGEKCPTHWAAHVPTLKTPSVIGQSFEHAYDTLLKKGYNSRFIDVFYGNGGAVDQQDIPRVDGEVCKQYPQPGQPFDPSENVKLYVAVGKCPHT